MSNIRPQLTEKIAILTENDEKVENALSYKKYKECHKARAKIQQLGCLKNNEATYYIAFQLPPATLQHVPFVGVSWKGDKYIFTSPLKINKNGFMYGSIKATK